MVCIYMTLFPLRHKVLYRNNPIQIDGGVAVEHWGQPITIRKKKKMKLREWRGWWLRRRACSGRLVWKKVQAK